MNPSSPAALALPHLAGLHAYAPGMQPAEPGWVKLNTNECPYPPSPRVAEALLREIGSDGALLRLYPNPPSMPLRRIIARLHGLGEEHVCVGNGSDDVLNLLVRCFCGPEAAAGFARPSYSLYPVLVAVQNGRSAALDFDRSMSLPHEAIAAAQPRILFLTSPNAPTGVGFANAELERVLGACGGVLVVDEAYAPFADENAASLVARHPRLVVTRSLSKAYALAGLRVGYALAHPEVIGLLDRVRDSYNVNRLSQAAAAAALEDGDYYSGVIARIKATRDRCWREWSERRGWFTYRSAANFLLTEPRNARGLSGPAVARAACDFLADRRILVRHFPGHPLTESFLRVSVGTDGEMAALDRALDAWLETGGS